MDESESRTIAHRPDINALLSNHMKSHILSKEAVKNMRDSAKSKFPDKDVLIEYWQGATYIPFDDAIELQRQIGKIELLEVIVDHIGDDDTQKKILIKVNWPLRLVYSHPIYSGSLLQLFRVDRGHFLLPS